MRAPPSAPQKKKRRKHQRSGRDPSTVGAAHGAAAPHRRELVPFQNWPGRRAQQLTDRTERVENFWRLDRALSTVLAHWTERVTQ